MILKLSQMAQLQWIVEIRGERHGPMTTQQVVHRLMRKELKVINRVSETDEGWVAICNEPIFEEYIHRLIEQVARQVAEGSMAKAAAEEEGVNDDSTVVSQDLGELSGVFNMNAIKQGISDQLSHAKELQQASQNLTLLRNLLSEIRIKRKVVIVADDKPPAEEDEIHPDDKDVYVLTKRNFSDYVSSGSSKLLFSVLLIAVFSWLGIQWKEKREKDEELAMIEAQQEKRMKNMYSGTLGNENEVMTLNPEDLIQKANQMLGEQRNKTEWSLVETSKSGVYMPVGVSRPDNYKEQRDVFRALNKQAYEFLLGGELKRAEEFLLKSLALYSEEKHIAILLLAETAILLNQAEKSKLSQIRLRQIISIINKYRSANEGASTKLYVAEMAMYYTLDDRRGLKRTVNKFLEQHPRGEKEPGTVGYLQKVSWSGLIPHCINIYGSDNADARMSAMLAGCLVRTPSANKAEPYIYYAYKKKPGDELIKNLLGWVYFDIGQYNKAKKLLWDPSIPSFQVSKYLTFSRIEFCRSQDRDPVCSGRGTASDK